MSEKEPPALEFVAKHGEGYGLVLQIPPPAPVAIDANHPQLGTVLKHINEAREVTFHPRFLTSRGIEVALATFFPDRQLVSGMMASQQPTQVREYEWVSGNGIDDDVIFEVMPTKWAAASDARTLMSAFNTGDIPAEHRDWYNTALLSHGALGRDFVQVTEAAIPKPWARYDEIKGHGSWAQIEPIAEALGGTQEVYIGILRYEQNRKDPRSTVVDGVNEKITELLERAREADLLRASLTS